VADFTIEIAGHSFRIHSLFESTREYCKRYLTEKNPQMQVTVTPEDLVFEQRMLDEEAVEEESGLPTWAIILISVGGALVVGVAAFIVIRKVRRAKAKKREEEATVNAYKRKKIDTTDDKSIDVYADENAEEISEESEKSDETEE
jgi:flagellar biosynthesis/type III secretory pathway M-ring protein FliF/YscJ